MSLGRPRGAPGSVIAISLRDDPYGYLLTCRWTCNDRGRARLGRGHSRRRCRHRLPPHRNGSAPVHAATMMTIAASFSRALSITAGPRCQGHTREQGDFPHLLWLEDRRGPEGRCRYVPASEFSADARGDRAGTAGSIGSPLGADLPASRAVSVRGNRPCVISANHQVPATTHDSNNPFIAAFGQGDCSAHRSTAASVTQLIRSTHTTRTRRCLNMRARLPAAVAITPFLHPRLGRPPCAVAGAAGRTCGVAARSCPVIT